MTRTLPARRHAEIDAKLGSLTAELEHWRGLTEQEETGLRRHHSQVRLLAANVGGAVERVTEQLRATATTSADVLAHGAAWEKDILAAHSIWEIFRSKLVLRQNALFRDSLAACDDLAWACYRPALERFAPGSSKTPPLVFLTTTWSPFAQSRETSFLNEVRAAAGPAGAHTGVVSALGGEPFKALLARLPVPLVGLPWYQVVHLPGATIIAHEVAHIVERDFGLTGRIAEALGALPERPDVWTRWAREVFADLYGCLLMGPAFVGALMDLLAASVEEVHRPPNEFGKYPSPALRVELALRALVWLEHEAESKRLRTVWEGSYHAVPPTIEYVGDIRDVLAAIYDGPDGPLAPLRQTDTVSFPHAVSAVETVTSAARQNQPAFIPAKPDPRLMFAAAQRLHEESAGADLAAAFKLLVSRTIAAGQSAFRYRGQPVPSKKELDAKLQADEAAERERGRELLGFLDELTNEPTTPAPADPPPESAPPDPPGS